MNKGDKFNSNCVIDKKKTLLIEENNVLYELKDRILHELSKVQVKNN